MTRSNVPNWLSKVLRHYGVTGIEIIFSSDSNLYDFEEQHIEFLFDHHERCGEPDIMTSEELKTHLEGLKVRMSADYAPSFWTVLIEKLTIDADNLFDQDCQDGGSLKMRVGLHEMGSQIEIADFTPNESTPDLKQDFRP